MISPRILCVIPARGGSKGILQKNLVPLGGKPLISFTIRVAQEVLLFTDVIISTDDKSIADIGMQYQVAVPFLRPAHLATDHSASIDVVLHALEFMQEDHAPYEAVCLLQPTVPFRDPRDVTQAIKTFIKSDVDSLISVRPIPHVYNPHWAFTQTDHADLMVLAMGDEEIIPRRQELPEAYHRDGSIYITRSSVIVDQHSFYGKRILGFQMENSPYINIDTPNDLLQAKQFIKDHPDFL